MRWLEIDGRPTFAIGQNPYGRTVAGHRRYFEASARAGEQIARLQIAYGLGPAPGPAGQIHEEWARRWEEVLREADAHRLRVIPVFLSWADWSDAASGSAWSRWRENPYNAANGGPATRPAELLEDSPTRRRVLAWLERLVRRLSTHENVLGWEIFSELDLLSGASPQAAVEFVERAAAVIRRADPQRRPVTASLSGADALPGKPVLVGEAGLAALPETGDPTGQPAADTLPRSHVGYRQALWTAFLSGYASGGMFWWMSGHPRPERTLRYPALSEPVARFAKGIELRGLRRVRVEGDPRIRGVALADPSRAIGYVRDERCVHPDWPSERVESRALVVRAELRGAIRVRYLRPRDLAPLGEAPVASVRGALRLDLPAFREDLVFVVE